MTIKLQLHHCTCEITVQRRLLSHLAAHLRRLENPYSSVVILASEKLLRLYGEEVIEEVAELEVPCHPIPIPDGEEAKSLKVAEECWKAMRAYHLDRRSLVLALGGGTTGDLAGFVAACYMRGISIVQLPTTLLAMVDAAIGGKTGVNFYSYKNMIGAFHQPTKVLIDPECLESLPDGEFTTGLAEVIKYGVIADAELFSKLEEEIDQLRKNTIGLDLIIERCAAIKAQIVEEDERESGRRALLNWGHTFGHALESATKMQLTHGQAVAIGMSCGAHLSQALGLVGDAFINRLDRLIQRAGLPYKLPRSIDLSHLVSLMRADKKSVSGGITCIVAEAIGRVRVERQVKEAIIIQALENKSHSDASG